MPVVATREVTTAARVRLDALDIVRGAVMVLMAINHVRVYSGVPAGGPTAGVFFTRWVTHFCAPAFVFLAGTGAFLHGRALAGTSGGTEWWWRLPRREAAALARYLVTRGLMLVVLELTVIRACWTFNVDYSTFVLAGVIWMLGWCMVILAGLVWLPTGAIGVIGLAIVFLQQIFGLVPGLWPQFMRSGLGSFWEFVYPAGLEPLPGIAILYVLVPWIGVMAAGYAFGAIAARAPADRRRLCLRIGLTATAVFVAGAIVFAVMSPAGDNPRPFLFRVLDQRKYPASQLFLLMTLGPTIALIPYADRARGWLADVLKTFGRVPLFYYLLHIPAIHLAALAVTFLREGSVHPEWYATAPFTSVPPQHRWSLALLYLVFAIVVAALYVPCQWYARVKAERRVGWMRYI